MSVEAYEILAHDWLATEFAINDLATRVVGQEVHPTSSPTFANGTITTDLTVGGDLTLAGSLVMSELDDGGVCYINGSLEIDTDVANFAWDYTNKKLTINGKVAAGAFGSPIDVTNTRQYGFEIHYSGNDYNATAIRARAHAVTTDTSAQFQGGLFQAANNDDVSVGVLNGLVAEAIGKATLNAATIIMMRGALVGAEWSAKDTVTDLRTLHVRTHTRDNATEGYFSNSGYGIYIENEAVGGNGQALDAGIYFKGTNLSAGNKAYNYGIDFTGATYGTAEIIFSNGESISNLVDGSLNFGSASIITSSLTAGRVLFVGTGGLIRDIGGFTFNSGTGGLSISGDITAASANLTGSVNIRDFSTGFDLQIMPLNGTVTGDDTNLNIAVGGAHRTLTFTGDATVNQDVSTAGSPSFVDITATDDLTVDGETQLGTNPNSAGTSVGIGVAPADDKKLYIKMGSSGYNPGNTIVGFRVEARTGGSGTRSLVSYAFQGLLTVGGTNTNSANNYVMYPQALIRDSGNKTGNVRGCYAQVKILGGHSPVVDEVSGYYSELIADEGTFTLAVNYHAKTPTKSTGEITTFAHLWLEDVGAAPDTGYAIYSAGGDSYHVGDLAFGQIDKAERIGSDADGTLDLYAGTSIDLHADTKLDNANFHIFDKASGNGIKVDTTTPTFGFADLLGDVTVKNTGGTRPNLIAYRDGLLEFEFAATEEEYFKYHIPHDYVKGTDIFLHFHWSTNGEFVNGGTVTFDYEISYSKGHAQAAFPASVSGTVVSATASTQYTHELTEVQISASTPSGSQIDTDDLEPDGIIICTAGLNANNLTVSQGGVPDPFIHYVDIHYQTTGLIGTKDKAPDFYA